MSLVPLLSQALQQQVRSKSTEANSLERDLLNVAVGRERATRAAASAVAARSRSSAAQRPPETRARSAARQTDTGRGRQRKKNQKLLHRLGTKNDLNETGIDVLHLLLRTAKRYSKPIIVFFMFELRRIIT
jgi:hypothetical protein